MATNTQKPIHKIRIGAIQGSFLEQTPEKGQPFPTVTFSRSYKDKSDQWMRQHRLFKAKPAA